MSITLTNRHKTHVGWNVGLDKYLTPGDSIDEAMADYFLEMLPPTYFDPALIQLGEPADHKGPKGAARYPTIQKHAGAWIYTGPQTRGTRCEIGGGQ